MFSAIPRRSTSPQTSATLLLTSLLMAAWGGCTDGITSGDSAAADAAGGQDAAVGVDATGDDVVESASDSGPPVCELVVTPTATAAGANPEECTLTKKGSCGHSLPAVGDLSVKVLSVTNSERKFTVVASLVDGPFEQQNPPVDEATCEPSLIFDARLVAPAKFVCENLLGYPVDTETWYYSIYEGNYNGQEFDIYPWGYSSGQGAVEPVDVVVRASFEVAHLTADSCYHHNQHFSPALHVEWVCE